MKPYKAVQAYYYKALVPSCTFWYHLIQGYRTFGHFLVLPCPALYVMYPLADLKEIFLAESTVHAGIYKDIPVYAGIYQHILCFMTQGFSLKSASGYNTVQGRTGQYNKVPDGVCWYMLVYTSIYWYMLVYTSM